MVVLNWDDHRLSLMIATNTKTSLNIGYCEGRGKLTSGISCPELEAFECVLRIIWPNWRIDGSDPGYNRMQTLQRCRHLTPSPVPCNENHAVNERVKVMHGSEDERDGTVPIVVSTKIRCASGRLGSLSSLPPSDKKQRFEPIIWKRMNGVHHSRTCRSCRTRTIVL